MKSTYIKAKEMLKNKKGVFGLTAVQQFFAIILGIALLAYVIVVIMGTLQTSSILPTSTVAASVANETGGTINTAGYTLAKSSLDGFGSPVITVIINTTDGLVVNSGNYTVSSGGVLTNTSVNTWDTVKVSYTYKYNSVSASNAKAILGNTSSGISSFFGNVSPVYAILAILVIILVLVVLVRVVTGGNATGRQSELQL